MLFPRSSKDRGGSSVRPNVSITPISDSSVTIGDSESSKNRGVATTGIEIIPLGAALTTGAGSQLKSKVPFHLRIFLIEAKDVLVIVMSIKVRDLKRSLSEDDKRRLDKKEKRKREEKARAAHAAGVGAHCWHHAEVENTVLKQTFILFRRAWAQQVTGSDRAAWWWG